MLSGVIIDEVAVEVMRAGAHDCLLKDRLARLGPAVERELGQARERRERKRAEEALRDSHDGYLNILATTLDGFWRGDVDGAPLDVNCTYVRQSGYSREELLDISRIVAGTRCGWSRR
jgi:PAS domain-containing protein